MEISPSNAYMCVRNNTPECADTCLRSDSEPTHKILIISISLSHILNMCINRSQTCHEWKNYVGRHTRTLAVHA